MSSVSGHGQTSAAVPGARKSSAPAAPSAAGEHREAGAKGRRDPRAAVQVGARGGELERDEHDRDRADQRVDLDPDEPERGGERLEVTQRRGEQRGDDDGDRGDRDAGADPRVLPRAPEDQDARGPERCADERGAERRVDRPGEEGRGMVGEEEGLRAGEQVQDGGGDEQAAHAAGEEARWRGHATDDAPAPPPIPGRPVHSDGCGSTSGSPRGTSPRSPSSSSPRAPTRASATSAARSPSSRA